MSYCNEFPETIDSTTFEQVHEWAMVAGVNAPEGIKTTIFMTLELIRNLDIVENLLTRASADFIGNHDAVLVQYSMQIAYFSGGLNLNLNPDFQRLVASDVKMQKIAAAPKKRMAKWVTEFAPIARAYCQGRAKVTYGQLRRRAREWAEEHKGRGVDWVLPQDDGSLDKGIKKLVRLGLLTIPGKEGGA
jgi:hypothetical protein